jgi:hypothetical protein
VANIPWMSDVCTVVLTGYFDYSTANQNTSIDFLSHFRRKNGFFFHTQDFSLSLRCHVISVEFLLPHHLVILPVQLQYYLFSSNIKFCSLLYIPLGIICLIFF